MVNLPRHYIEPTVEKPICPGGNGGRDSVIGVIQSVTRK